MSWLGCGVVKGMLLGPVLLGIGIFVVLAIFAVCAISALMGGVIIWSQFMTYKLGKPKITDSHTTRKDNEPK